MLENGERDASLQWSEFDISGADSEVGKTGDDLERKET